MSFIARWLGLGNPDPRVGLRPHRNVTLPMEYDAAYARVLEAIELALGAYVSIDDRRNGLIEAAFGLVNNERVRCTLTRVDEAHTDVRVEAFFPAGTETKTNSPAVDALAHMLEAGIGT